MTRTPGNRKLVMAYESAAYYGSPVRGSILIWSCLVVILYGTMIYFNAATASMGDSFQPGISNIKSLSWPSLLLIVLAFITIMLRTTGMIQMLKIVSVSAVFLCVFLLV